MTEMENLRASHVTSTDSLHRRSQAVHDDVTIVIPTMNEEEGICSVIEKTRSAGFSNILVCDSGSTDKTAELVNQMQVRLVTQHGKGKADALDTAIGFVETPYMAFIDGDDTYDPNDINTMLEHISDADQVIGSRVLGGMNGNKGQNRYLARGHEFGNRLLNFVFNGLFGQHLTDVLSGIRLFRLESLKQIHLRSAGFEAEAEVTAECLMDGRKVIETPAHFNKRLGKAKLRKRDGFHILFSILRFAYEYNPLLYFLPVGVVMGAAGLGILLFVVYNAYLTSSHVFHSGYALAGLGFFLVGVQLFSMSLLALLLKRSELRQLRAIRRS